jgi:tetratricopeptide (TPR) repeat protein
VLYDVQSKTFSPTLAINTVASRIGSADSSTWTHLAEIYAEMLTDFAAKSASEVIEQSLPLFAHAAAVSIQEKPQDVVRTHLRLADLYAAQGDQAAVIETLRRALDAEPANRDALIRLASVLIDSGDLSSAAIELEKIFQQDPAYTPAITALIEIYLNQKRYQEAQSLIQQAVEKSDTDNRLTYAAYALRAQAWQLADKLARQALATDENNLDAYSILVEVALREKRHEDALQFASEAYSRFPNSAAVCQMAAIASREANRFDLAELYLERLEKINPSDPQGLEPHIILTERAILAERRNDIPQMEQLFRQVLQLDPENHFAMNYMAYTWADRGINLQEALTLITKAISLEPDNSAYLDTLGWVHYQLGDFPKAYEFISRALEIGPPHEEILENLGDAAHALGRTEEALRHWQESLRLQPDRPFVQEKIDAVQRGETLTHPIPYRPLPDQPPLAPTPPQTENGSTSPSTNDTEKNHTNSTPPHHPEPPQNTPSINPTNDSDKS